ncbi:MAG: bifunctional riboflavin kinase/FAD synthetase [Bacillota bacterium]
MHIVRGIEQLSNQGRGRVMALGNFDGLHRAHQELVRRLVDKARQDGLVSSLMVFDPHPLELLCPDRAPRLLTLPEQRAELLRQFGVDELVIVAFTDQFSRLSPEEFASRILASYCGVRAVVVGYDYSFGKMGKGQPADLVRLGRDLGFETIVVDPVTVDGQVVSSTSIRALLAEGNVRMAARLLGRPFALSGRVVHGEARGRAIGYPTANIAIDPRLLLPRYGVYATRQRLNGSLIRGITNVGIKPTFAGQAPTVEVHCLDMTDHLYDQEMTVEFAEFIRPEQRFGDAQELRDQIDRDCQLCREILGEL